MWCLNIFKWPFSVMGFTIENILSADGQFGTENPETGDWSGIVGHLKRREGDMVGEKRIGDKKSKS